MWSSLIFCLPIQLNVHYNISILLSVFWRFFRMGNTQLIHYFSWFVLNSFLYFVGYIVFFLFNEIDESSNVDRNQELIGNENNLHSIEYDLTFCNDYLYCQYFNNLDDLFVWLTIILCISFFMNLFQKLNCNIYTAYFWKCTHSSKVYSFHYFFIKTIIT